METASVPAATYGLGQSPHDLSVFPDALRDKRILLCTESFGPVNGVSRTTLMLVNHLRAHGAVVAVVAPHNHTKKDHFVPNMRAANASHKTATAPTTAAAPATAKILPADGDTSSSSQNMEIRIHGYPLPYNPELSIVYPVRLSTLYARTFGAPPDLIYLASPASLGFQVLLQLRQQSPEHQVPVLCNFQTDLAGYCAILFPPPFSDLAVYTFAGVQSFLFRHSSVRTIFYPSRFVRRYLEKNGVSGDKLALLRRGVNTELFTPSRRSDALRAQIAPNGEIILVCVARLAGEKGFEFLALAARALARNPRALPFKLLIVGGNRNAAVEADVKALFAVPELRGHVVFAGFQVGEALAAHYASADIFLHASITETFGLVVLESMASGVPVVARDEGGPSDIVLHQKTGFLIPPADMDVFVERTAELMLNVELRTKFAAASRAAACEATWEKIGNTVAWRMAEVLEEREGQMADAQLAREEAGAEAGSQEGSAVAGEAALGSRRSVRRLSAMAAGAGGDEGTPLVGRVRSQTPVFGWLFLSEALTARIVDSRLTGALAVILGFWGAVGLYLIFIKAALWAKARLRS